MPVVSGVPGATQRKFISETEVAAAPPNPGTILMSLLPPVIGPSPAPGICWPAYAIKSLLSVVTTSSSCVGLVKSTALELFFNSAMTLSAKLS